MIKQHEHYMKMCVKLATKAYDEGEIPVGAIIVCGDKVIAKAYNKRNKSKNAIHHAEILAIEKACKVVGDWRLENCDMYVTLMPCPMCAGAIVNARIKNVFFGTDNDNKLLFEQIMSESALNHKTNYCGGIMQPECTKLLQNFFVSKRGKEAN